MEEGEKKKKKKKKKEDEEGEFEVFNEEEKSPERGGGCDDLRLFIYLDMRARIEGRVQQERAVSPFFPRYKGLASF